MFPLRSLRTGVAPGATVGFRRTVTGGGVARAAGGDVRAAIDLLRAGLVRGGEGWGGRPVRGAADLERCAALQAESLLNRGVDPSGRMEGIRRRLAVAVASDILVLVASTGGCEAFLWVSLRTIRDWPGVYPVCHVESIVVTAASRGRGLGTAILEHLEVCVRAAGFAGVSLNSFADNTRVAALYRRLGYALVGLDLEKVLSDSAAPGALTRSRGTSPEVTPLRDAFEPAGDTPPHVERFARAGVLVGRVGTTCRRAGDGATIVVFDPFVPAKNVTSVALRELVADREHAARGQGAMRAYVTVWEPQSSVSLGLQALGYQIGRHKWWRPVA